MARKRQSAEKKIKAAPHVETRCLLPLKIYVRTRNLKGTERDRCGTPTEKKGRGRSRRKETAKTFSRSITKVSFFLYRTAPYKIFTFYSSNLRKRMVNMEAAATMGDPFLAGVQKHEKDATFHRRCVFCV